MSHPLARLIPNSYPANHPRCRATFATQINLCEGLMVSDDLWPNAPTSLADDFSPLFAFFRRSAALFQRGVGALEKLENLW